MNNVNVIFNEDLFDETELRVVPLELSPEGIADFPNSDRVLSAACDIVQFPEHSEHTQAEQQVIET